MKSRIAIGILIVLVVFGALAGVKTLQIKKLIAGENPANPLSDSRIAELLAADGARVARRTVAKYREAMQIAPSGERRRVPAR